MISFQWILVITAAITAGLVVIAIQQGLALRGIRKALEKFTRRIVGLGGRVRNVEDASGGMSRRIGVVELNATQDAEKVENMERLIKAGGQSRELLGLAGQFVAASCEDLNKRVTALEEAQALVVFTQGGDGGPN